MQIYVNQVLFSVTGGSQSLGGAFMSVGSMAAASGAGQKIFNTIKRTPKIDSQSPSGIRIFPDTIKGHIAFENVKFVYPQRPKDEVVNGLTFNIKSGERMALVGESGCGKSTIVQLL